MFCQFRNVLVGIASRCDWLPGLLSRICIGITFIQSGWGKLHHLDKVIAFFISLGIPAADLQAPFVAGVELAGGSFVLAGFMTRIASAPLIGTMGVAILTAKRGDIHELGDLLFMPEFLLIAMLCWLIVKGAGALSVDYLLAKRCDEK